MHIAHCRRETVDTGRIDEAFRISDTGHHLGCERGTGRKLGEHLRGLSYIAEFCLDDYVATRSASRLDDILGHDNIVFNSGFRAVINDRICAGRDSGLHLFKTIGVIGIEEHIDAVSAVEIDKCAGMCERKIIALAFGEPDDDRKRHCFCRRRDRAELIGVGDIKMPDRASLRTCFGDHFSKCFHTADSITSLSGRRVTLFSYGI